MCYKEKILGIPVKVCEKEWIPCEYRYVTTVNDYYFYQYQNWSKLDESISMFTNGLNYTGTFDSETLDFMDQAIFRIVKCNYFFFLSFLHVFCYFCFGWCCCCFWKKNFEVNLLCVIFG